MIRNVLAVVAGLLAGGLAVGGMQGVGMTLIPPPEGMAEAFRNQDFEQMTKLIQRLPLGSLLFVLLSYASGAMIGGLVASWIASVRSHPWPAMVVGTILFLFAVINFYQIPHPLWFAAASLLTFHPAAWLGSWLAQRFIGKPSSPSKPSLEPK